MTSKNQFKNVVIWMISLAVFSPLFSQTLLKYGTFGNGGISAAGSGNLIKGTVNQTAVGIAASTGFVVRAGFWQGAHHITTVEDLKFDIPSVYELYQNYPNPFNPSTTIKYDLPAASYIKIEVYNLLGQKVISLVDEEKPAGKYAINFDGFNLASGVYFYSIETEQFRKVKRMLLTK